MRDYITNSSAMISDLLWPARARGQINIRKKEFGVAVRAAAAPSFLRETF